MAWTYAGDPANSALEEVRFLIGDTDTNDQQLTDAEINYLLTESSDVALHAAIRGAKALQAKYSRQADYRNGALALQASQRADSYAKLAADLTKRATLDASADFGGTSITDNEALAADTDAVQPYFEVGMDDYEGSTPRSRWEDDD